MKRRIELTDGAVRKEICKALGISKPLLSLALSFRRNSRKCIAARQMALENGGILMEEKEVISRSALINGNA